MKPLPNPYRFILAGIAALFVASLYMMTITSDRWVRLESLTVTDTVVGGDAVVDYQREFYRPFAADWNVSVYVMERGEWAAYRNCYGYWPDYQPGIPNPRKSLSWLSGDNAGCWRLPRGIYRVKVTLTINPNSIISRDASVISNTFEVHGV